jgi:mevalonate kinase
MQSVSASAPGKIILFGEHAVVHGQPAIAVPLTSVKVTVAGAPARAGSGITLHAPDIDRTVRLSDPALAESSYYDALVFPIQLALQHLVAAPPDLELTVRSLIPVASGLGSGAALAAALIRAVGLALGTPFDNPTLNTLVYEVEKRHHGTPSGIDNTVIVFQQPVYFVRDQPIETFRIARPFTLLVADTGVSAPTRETVGDVNTLYQHEPARVGAIFARIGAITREARDVIESGKIEALGPLMDENHRCLQALAVSSPELDHLGETARRAGAWGAKLSGGGRGGNLISLAAADRVGAVARALRHAGAVSVIRTNVG